MPTHPAPLRPSERINSTAGDPPEFLQREVPIGEADVVADPVPYGEMNEEDARESGYITTGSSEEPARN